MKNIIVILKNFPFDYILKDNIIVEKESKQIKKNEYINNQKE